jgi:DMSO reductase family type II enzyme heme b subunit
MRGSLQSCSISLGLALLAGLAFIVGRPRLPWGAAGGTAQAQVDGQTIYTERCAFCHGDEGDGNGPVAKYLDPRPRDFTSGQFKFRTTASGELPLRQDVIQIVRNGVRGTAMPSWQGILSQAEIEAVVDYVTQTFVPDWGSYEPTVIVSANERPPRVTADLIAQGAQLYQDLQCWRCHGQAGRGDGPSAPTLTDDFDFPIRAADLSKAWRYKGGSELGDIYARFSTGLNGSPMPSFYEVISDEERWALSAYVKSLQTDQPTEQTVVLAKRLADALPASADDPAWEQARPASFYLTGQVIAGPRWQTPGVDAVTVRALYNDQSVALLVEWDDPFHDAEAGGSEPNVPADTYVDLDQFLGTVGPFPDALAVQFPQRLSEGPQKPHFFWGQPGQPVYLWKWQADGTVGEYNATGFRDGLKPQATSEVTASATWADGRYRLVFTRALVTGDPNDVPLTPGAFIPIAFQAWEGSNGESGMRLSLSSWFSLVLEKPVPASVYLYTGLAVVLVAAGEWALVRRARGASPPGERTQT